MKRFVLLIEDDMGSRKYWPCDAKDSNEAEDLCLAEHDENTTIITIYVEE